MCARGSHQACFSATCLCDCCRSGPELGQ
jgi:hypothetical protein